MVYTQTVRSTPLPSLYHLAHNGVIFAQAFLVLLSPLTYLTGTPENLDRPMDLLFASYLGLIGLRCVLDRPTYRLLGALVIVGAYAAVGLTEAMMTDNLRGFAFEFKLLISISLFFCMLDKRPTVSEKSLQILFVSFLIASCVFLVISKGARLHIINESNYLCMYIGIAMFSYLSWKGKSISHRTLIGLGLFTLFLIVSTQSRTGTGFLAITWLIYLWERFGFRAALFSGVLLTIFAAAGFAAAVAINAPIVKRFQELRDPTKVDRFIFMTEAAKLMKMRPFHENIVRLPYASPVSTRVDEHMKWLTDEGRHGTVPGQLYPHHFHLAYLRILIGHGFVPLFLYFGAIILLWRVNKYLSVGIAVCSLSMSVPYLSLFFGALHIAMAFPSSRLSNEST